MKKILLPTLVAILGACGAPAPTFGDLLSLYNFNGNANNTIPTAPNGTLVGGPTFVTGQLGQAISLNGGYVDLTTDGFPKASAIADPSNGLWSGSAAFWINTTSADGGALMGGVNSNDSTLLNLYMNDGAPGAYSIAFRSAQGRADVVNVTSPTIDWRDGAWHNISFTWDLATQSYAGYIDGVSQPLSTASNIPNTDTFAAWDNPMRIGVAARATPGSDVLIGSVDDVGVWSTALSAASAAAINSLGRDTTLHYGGADAEKLFEIYAGGPGSQGQTSDGKTWHYVTGVLGGAPGQVVNNHTGLVMDSLGGGLSAIPLIQGDLNLDGVVNLVDYGILKNHWLQSGTTLSDGDVNFDGVVNVADFGIFKQYYHNFNGGSGSALVPEPSTWMLLLGAIPALAVVRRARREAARARHG